MNSVPSSPDPESGPPTRPVTGRQRADAVPPLSIGGLEDVRPGALIVAMPALSDPTFAGTVVYVLDHTDTGTLGVVLGRPSQVEIRDVLPGWCDLAGDPGRPARVVRLRRGAGCFPRGRPVLDRHRAVPGHRPGRGRGRRRGLRPA